jgi:UDP-2,3-diacylglucosamine hydrolase
MNFGHSMRKTYFFSDAHLGLTTNDDDRDRERSIVRFLSAIGHDAEEVFILGDLFDYWFEYESVVPKGYFRLFTALADLNERGVRLTYLAGNHDFWLKSYFRDEFGMAVSFDPVERTIGGKRFYLHHGDGVMRGDSGYKLLKRVLRNKLNIRLFSWLHPDLATRIARWSSRTSRSYTSKKQYEQDGMVEFARQKLREGFDFVIMGHNHRPLVRNLNGGVYVNLGDWIDARSYAVFDGTGLELRYWEATNDSPADTDT